MRNHCLLWLCITSVLTLGSPAFAAIDGSSRLIGVTQLKTDEANNAQKTGNAGNTGQTGLGKAPSAGQISSKAGLTPAQPGAAQMPGAVQGIGPKPDDPKGMGQTPGNAANTGQSMGKPMGQIPTGNAGNAGQNRGMNIGVPGNTGKLQEPGKPGDKPMGGQMGGQLGRMRRVGASLPRPTTSASPFRT